LEERLWAIRKGDRSVMAELCQDRRGYEVRLFNDGHCFASHALGSRELAVLYARVIERDLVANGWQKTRREIP
jgi:hypothetical protein